MKGRTDSGADLAEITQVLQRYFAAIDEKDWALLGLVFTPGAVLRYSVDTSEGEARSCAEMVGRFRSFVEACYLTQHLMGTPLVEIVGDAARATTALRAIHVQRGLDGERATWVVYGTYRDALVRTPQGWRIEARDFRILYTEGELLPARRAQRFETPPWPRRA